VKFSAGRLLVLVLYLIFLLVLDQLPLLQGTLGGVVKVSCFLFPLVLLLQAGYSAFTLRYVQNFSREHLEKGEKVVYTLTLENGGILPSVLIRTTYEKTQPFGHDQWNEQWFSLQSGESLTLQREVECPYRGIYTIGLAGLEVQDFLGLFVFTLPIWHRTFYVYPRQLQFPMEHIEIAGVGAGQISHHPWGQRDYSLFSHSRPYREGESLSHFDWKRWAGRDQMVLREFERQVSRGVVLFWDITCPEGVKTEKQWAAEDGLFEVLIALLKALLQEGIPVKLVYYAPELTQWTFQSLEDWSEFIRHTLEIHFHPGGIVAESLQDCLGDTGDLIIGLSLSPENLLMIGESLGGPSLSVLGILAHQGDLDPTVGEVLGHNSSDTRGYHIIKTGGAKMVVEL